MRSQLLVCVLLLLSLFVLPTGSDAGDEPEEDPPDPPPNTAPYMLEPPFNVVYLDEEFEWEGRVAVEDNDTVEWDLITNMTEDDYDEFEWNPENYSFKLKIKPAQLFARWINLSVTDNVFPAAYWNWTLFCIEDDGGTRGDDPLHHSDFYWCGSACGGDEYQWDDEDNWRDDTTWTVNGYPQDNGDRAFFNETGDDLYLVHAANSVVTLGELKLSSGFTGTVTMAIDLVIDDAAAHDGHMEVSAGTWDANTSNEQINLDGYLHLLDTGAFVERSGIVIVQGAATQEIKVQDTNKLYKLTTDTASTVGELYDNLTAFQITIGTGTTYKADANTRGYELWTNFSDVAGCGFVSTSSGTLNLIGTYGGRQANITTADAAPPPTNYWAGTPVTSGMRVTLRNTTMSYSKKMGGYGGIQTLDNVSFSNIVDSYAIHFRDVWVGTSVKDVTVTGTATWGWYFQGGTWGLMDNLDMSGGTWAADLRTNGQREFINSNFDVTKISWIAGGRVYSDNHNDVAADYKIAIKSGESHSKSTITNDFATGDNIELVSGTFTIDEASASNDFEVASGAMLKMDASTTHTFDAGANMTVTGYLNMTGANITTGSGYFDFYAPGVVWLNDSTVTSADLVLDFNYSIGATTNTTLNDYVIEPQTVGYDMNIVISSETYANKGSGVVFHMNASVICSSCFVPNEEFMFGNLTAGEDYRLYRDSVLVDTVTANGTGWVAYKMTIADPANHLYLTWYSGAPPPPPPPGPGQYDRWIVGFKYSKNFFTNEVRFEAISHYDHNASWYIWDFGGQIYESASPNVTRNFQFAFYSTENVKLTIIFTDGNRYWMESPVVLDNSLWIALLCLTLISLGAVMILHTRRARTKTELIMVETEGR